MDTGYDFITPEFFDILFFKQKNLVIFPYVDVKHLHSLDCFTVGHDIVDIDSTGLSNIHDIIEFESTNSYSQQPTLYFLLNVCAEDLEKIMEYQNIRCIINTSDSVEHLANSNKYIFYNKKNRIFLNYQSERENLKFEQYLFQISQNEQVLLDEVSKIKRLASKIFTEINNYNNPDKIPTLMREYDQIYWDKILSFTQQYFNVQIPEVKRPKAEVKEKNTVPIKDFSEEYEFILKTNRKIGQKFIQLLHDYRAEKVNPAHLELDQLYYPNKLYNYLRNHHWKKGISQDFIATWIQKLNENSHLDENDQSDFQDIFDKLGISSVKPFSIKKEISPTKNRSQRNSEITKEKTNKAVEPIPSIKDFKEFKNWLLKKLDDLEHNFCLNTLD
ncbi:MAG: hypothetical protein EAX91_10050 [Candidatus Lokiarchaeota archaeon]|nr:hypothetical protein [Candidatus Lokiarchaeota archaeon]